MSLALGIIFLVGGAVSLAVGGAAQRHAPQPGPAQAGALGPAKEGTGPRGGPTGAAARSALEQLAASARSWRWGATGLVLARSRPVTLDIPAIEVHASVGEVGLKKDGTIQVPSLFANPGEAAWYVHSPTPGQIGPSVIVGHVDNAHGPAVFFRLGALAPGDRVEVTLADGIVATFVVDGVRSYPKAHFPTAAVYGPTDYAALRLITCGGAFDYATHQYLDSTVVFASLLSAQGRSLGQRLPQGYRGRGLLGHHGLSSRQPVAYPQITTSSTTGPAPPRLT